MLWGTSELERHPVSSQLSQQSLSGRRESKCHAQQPRLPPSGPRVPPNAYPTLEKPQQSRDKA